MNSRKPYIPHGVIPACLLPFDADFNIDELAYRAHLQDILSVDGITAIAINGHAAEVHALTIEEQYHVMAVTKEELQDKVGMAVGIHTDSSLEAGRLAARAQAEGADALLVFPPNFMSLGGDMRPEMIHTHIGHITQASDLPIILFQFPQQSNLAYSLSTLLSLCETYPTIRAVKDQIGDGNRHEQQIRELKALDAPVKTLTTHSAWLLGSLALGCEGILSGAGSVIADLQVALFRAMQSNDLQKARVINDRIYLTVRAFYDAPLLDMHNRMKEALTHLGKLKAAHVRPPLIKPTADEIAKIGRMLDLAGITDTTVYRNAV